MFLNRLEEVEKVAFLELAHYVGRCDDDFSDATKEVIAIYCAEMNVDNIEFIFNDFSLEETLGKFTSITSQKIVTLEIMALVYVDNFLHTEEQTILNAIIKKFNLSSNTSMIYAQWSKAMLALSIQGEALLSL